MLLKITDELAARLKDGDILAVYVCDYCRNLNIRSFTDEYYPEYCANCMKPKKPSGCASDARLDLCWFCPECGHEMEEVV